MNTAQHLSLLALAASSLGALANAQWSSDPAANLAVADTAGDQVQTKIAATDDGGFYVSWFDSIGNGFDVRLQKLDAGGQESWAHNGILVADRGFSSTQDYGLDVDSAGHALLTFRDDRFTGTQITAARVSPAGTLDWGAGGVQLTNTTNFVAAPKITGTGDGEVVVAWLEDVSTHVQRLSPAGVSQWGSDTVHTPASGSYSASDMHAAGTDVILSMVHQTGSFSSPKHLVAQKIDANGAILWGATPLAIFDSGSLQFGNFPTFKTDGAGGAVFSWYGVGPLQSYAQHVTSAGVESFPHNGSAGSNNGSLIHVSPSVDFDTATGETYLFWEQANGGQSQFGLAGQKFDSAGVPQWGAQGVTLIPIGSDAVRNVRTVVNWAGSFVFWTESPGFAQDTLKGRHLDATGATDIAAFDVCSLPSEKARVAAELGTTGQVVLGWTDKRSDPGDVYVQNVNADGSLGSSALGTPYCFGLGCPCGNDDAAAGCANSTGAGASLTMGGSGSVVADDLEAFGTSLVPGAPALLMGGTSQIFLPLPFGDGLRCAGGSIQRLGVQFANASGAAHWGPGLISMITWVAAGDTRQMQIWYRDNTGPCGSGFNVSHAVAVVFTP